MSHRALQFVATEVGSAIEEDVAMAGVACDEHYLTFQRSLPVGVEDDWGVHVEFDDQENSGYEKVRSCNLSRRRLRLEFTEPIDREKQHPDAEIELQISDSEFDSFASGLRAVFSQREHLLSIES